MQVHVIDIATCLAKETRVQPSVTILGAYSDMMRHLRKSIHCSLDDSNLGTEIIQWNRKFREAVDQCLIQLSRKVTVSFILLHEYRMLELNGVTPSCSLHLPFPMS